ncbi:MAG TPA: GFA family protein, partial [Gammaproteobacteria bacterium]
MLLEGSCHCGSVRFSVESHTPYPYMRCYCSICRKTGGGGGYAINIMGDAGTLAVEGQDHLQVYQALVPDEQQPEKLKPSEARRHFCRECGSALYLFDPR